jgi:hypothetical protein
VHLKLSDFKPDDDIMLHLMHGSDDCAPAATLLNEDYLKNLIAAKRVAKHDRDRVVQYCETQYELQNLPNNSTFIYQVSTADPSAMTQLREVLVERRLLVGLRQALYGTPTRLYYTSDHTPFSNDSRVLAYLKNVQAMCCERLEESSGSIVMM